MYRAQCIDKVCGVCCQSLSQQALMGTINSSMQAVQQAQSDLGSVDKLPPLGHDMVSPQSPNPPSHSTAR